MVRLFRSRETPRTGVCFEEMSEDLRCESPWVRWETQEVRRRYGERTEGFGRDSEGTSLAVVVRRIRDPTRKDKETGESRGDWFILSYWGSLGGEGWLCSVAWLCVTETLGFRGLEIL